MSFSDRLRTITKIIDFSQKRLAEMLGTSHQAVQQWMSGRTFPSSEMQVKILELGININWLLSGNGSAFADNEKGLLLKERHEKTLAWENSLKKGGEEKEFALIREDIPVIKSEASEKIAKERQYVSVDDFEAFEYKMNQKFDEQQSEMGQLREALKNFNEAIEFLRDTNPPVLNVAAGRLSKKK